MNGSESTQKLYDALHKAQAEFRPVGMTGDNKFDKYSYAKLEDYVRVVRPVFEKHGLAIITSVDDVVELKDRTTKSGGTEHAVRVKLSARIIHTSGEWIESLGWGEGQDRADKATYKAITGARKYALASALGLATGDDPEGDETVGTAPAPANRAKPPTTQIEYASEDLASELDRLITETKTPATVVTAWLVKAKANRFTDMPVDIAQKCINMLKKKLQPAAAV